MPPKQQIQPKKPPPRKRRSSTMLYGIDAAVERSGAEVQFAATPGRLKLNMRASTPAPRPAETPGTGSSSIEPPGSSILMPPPLIPPSDSAFSSVPPRASKRHVTKPQKDYEFNQLFASHASLFLSSDSPTPGISSQSRKSSFDALVRASQTRQTVEADTLDSQATYDDTEEKGYTQEDRGQVDQVEKEAEIPISSQRSQMRSLGKRSQKPAPSPPISKRPGIIPIADASATSSAPPIADAATGDLEESEKQPFVSKREKAKLNRNPPNLTSIGRSQKIAAKEYAEKLGHLRCFQISVKAIPYFGALAVAKRHTYQLDSAVDYEMVLEELQNWHNEKRKELVVELTYRFARNQTREIGKTTSVPKTTAILTRNGKLTTTKIPTSSTATARLLAQDAAQNEADPSLTIRRQIAETWECKKTSCDNHGQQCWIGKNGGHLPILNQDIYRWSAAISTDISGRLTATEPPTSIKLKFEKDLRNQGRRDRKKTISESAETPQQAPQLPWGMPPAGHHLPHYIPPYIPQLSPPSTSLQHTRTSQLLAELASRNALYYNRSISRSVSCAPSGPDLTRYSSLIEGDIEEYIKWQKRSSPRDQIPLEEAKNNLLDKLYSTDIIQGWKGDENEEKWEKLGIPAGLGRRLARDVGPMGWESSQPGAKILRSVEHLDSPPDRQPDGQLDRYKAFRGEDDQDDQDLTQIEIEDELDFEA
ncbi:hypothetical protein MMC21_005003 [Puttea exsequens]|nr:hypothetical protein [Puttea exsequens]